MQRIAPAGACGCRRSQRNSIVFHGSETPRASALRRPSL